MAQAWGRNYSLFNPLNTELNPIYHLLALLGTHHIFHVSRIRVNKHIHKSVLVVIGDVLDRWKSIMLDSFRVFIIRGYSKINLFVFKYVFKDTLSQ
jgi:hypothetical protein